MQAQLVKPRKDYGPVPPPRDTTHDGMFCLLSEGRSYQLRAETREEMLEWLATLRNTLVFGASLDSNSTIVPIIVSKCLDFIETHGLFHEVSPQRP